MSEYESTKSIVSLDRKPWPSHLACSRLQSNSPCWSQKLDQSSILDPRSCPLLRTRVSVRLRTLHEEVYRWRSVEEKKENPLSAVQPFTSEEERQFVLHTDVQVDRGHPEGSTVFALTSSDLKFVACTIENFLESWIHRSGAKHGKRGITFSFASSGPGFCVRGWLRTTSPTPWADEESLVADVGACGLRIFHCSIKLQRNAPLFTTPVRSDLWNSSSNESTLVRSSGNERSCSHTRLSRSVSVNVPISINERSFCTIVSLIPWSV